MIASPRPVCLHQKWPRAYLWLELSLRDHPIDFPELDLCRFEHRGRLRIPRRAAAGPRHPVAGQLAEWQCTLSSFKSALSRDGEVVDRGRASNVLDDPVRDLRHLVALLATDDVGPQLAAGEIVTNEAFSVASGKMWATQLSGVALQDARIRFARSILEWACASAAVETGIVAICGNGCAARHRWPSLQVSHTLARTPSEMPHAPA